MDDLIRARSQNRRQHPLPSRTFGTEARRRLRPGRWHSGRNRPGGEHASFEFAECVVESAGLGRRMLTLVVFAIGACLVLFAYASILGAGRL